MAGIKGKSGRKSRYQEIQEGNLLDICTTWLIDNFKTFDKDTKIKVALEIAKKGIVQKVDLTGKITWESLVHELSGAEARNTRQVQSISSN